MVGDDGLADEVYALLIDSRGIDRPYYKLSRYLTYDLERISAAAKESQRLSRLPWEEEAW